MNSVRLVGKVLVTVSGKPLIEYCLDRLRQSRKIGRIIVATSIDDSDTPIVEYCRQKQTQCFRGSLSNVARRFKDLIEKCKLCSFIRICADSPLIDPDLVDAGIDIFEKGNYEIVTNTLRRTFPKGQSFEILHSDVFMKGYADMEQQEDIEHITRYFYRNSCSFRIYNMETGGSDYSSVNLSIDTPEDLALFTKILNKMNRPFTDYGWEETVQIYRRIQRARTCP